MTGSTIVLLIEELVVGIINTIREENAYVNLRIVYFDIVCWIGITYIILCESLGFGILFVDRETGSKIGRGSQSVIPYGHLVEIAALVERDDTVFYHILHIAYGRRIVSQFYGKAERTIVQNLIILIAVRQYLILANHQTRSAQTECGAYTIRILSVSMIQMEGGDDIQFT